MATLDTDICNQALKLLRQDIEILGATGSPVAVKCASLYDIAYDAVATAHEWRTPMTGDTPSDATLRKLLVYSLARELAIPITGRQSDFEMMSAVLDKAMVAAFRSDLEKAFESETDTDLLEAVSLVRQYVVPDGSIPWGWASLKRKYDLVRDGARQHVLDYYGWSFCRREAAVVSTPAPGGRYVTAVPVDCGRILECWGEEGVVTASSREHGVILTREPVLSVEYIADTDSCDDWPLPLKKAYVASLAVLLALSMPTADAYNKTAALVQYRDSLLSTARMNDARRNRATYETAVHGNRYAMAMRGRIRRKGGTRHG